MLSKPILHISKRLVGECIDLKFTATEGESLNPADIKATLDEAMKSHAFSVELTPPKDSEMLRTLNYDYPQLSALIPREYFLSVKGAISALQEKYSVIYDPGKSRRIVTGENQGIG